MNNNIQKGNSEKFLLLSFVYEIMPVKKIFKRKNKVNVIEKNSLVTVMNNITVSVLELTSEKSWLSKLIFFAYSCSVFNRALFINFNFKSFSHVKQQIYK